MNDTLLPEAATRLPIEIRVEVASHPVREVFKTMYVDAEFGFFGLPQACDLDGKVLVG